MNPKMYEYDAVIQPADKGGAYVAFPYDIREEFGKGRVKVHATYDNDHNYGVRRVHRALNDEHGIRCGLRRYEVCGHGKWLVE